MLGKPMLNEEEKDLLSNIIEFLNEIYGLDLTEEDAVDVGAMIEKLNQHEELRQVMNSDNTLANMKYKFDKVVDDLLLGIVNEKSELYKKLTDPKVDDLFKHKWFEGYLGQFKDGVGPEARV